MNKDRPNKDQILARAEPQPSEPASKCSANKNSDGVEDDFLDALNQLDSDDNCILAGGDDDDFYAQQQSLDYDECSENLQ